MMGVKGIQKGDGSDLSTAEAAASPDAETAIDNAVAELTDGPVIPLPTNSAETEEGLSTVSSFDSSVRIGGGEMQLAQLTLEAKRESGLTSTRWNELSEDERSAYIRNTVDRLRSDEEIASTEAAEAVITVPVKDVRVHEDRGIGGRYVSLGGGERIRVAEASTNSDTPIKDDQELKSA